jgi:hypothetical protein
MKTDKNLDEILKFYVIGMPNGIGFPVRIREAVPGHAARTHRPMVGIP